MDMLILVISFTILIIYFDNLEDKKATISVLSSNEGSDSEDEEQKNTKTVKARLFSSLNEFPRCMVVRK